VPRASNYASFRYRALQSGLASTRTEMGARDVLVSQAALSVHQGNDLISAWIRVPAASGQWRLQGDQKHLDCPSEPLGWRTQAHLVGDSIPCSPATHNASLRLADQSAPDIVGLGLPFPYAIATRPSTRPDARPEVREREREGRRAKRQTPGPRPTGQGATFA